MAFLERTKENGPASPGHYYLDELDHQEPGRIGSRTLHTCEGRHADHVYYACLEFQEFLLENPI